MEIVDLNTEDPHKRLSSTALVALESSKDYRDASLNTLKTAINLRTNLLRDHSVTGMAVVGAGLAVLSTNPQIVKSIPALIVGLVFVLISVLVAFVARDALISYAENFVGREHTDYLSIADASRNLISDIKNESLKNRLVAALELKKSPIAFGLFREYAHKATGLLLFLGIFIIVTAIIY